MTAILTVLVVIGVIMLALVLAYVPLRLAVGAIARNATEKVRQFIERTRERRLEPRDGPDRRTRDLPPEV